MLVPDNSTTMPQSFTPYLNNAIRFGVSSKGPGMEICVKRRPFCIVYHNETSAAFCSNMFHQYFIPSIARYFVLPQEFEKVG